MLLSFFSCSDSFLAVCFSVKFLISPDIPAIMTRIEIMGTHRPRKKDRKPGSVFIWKRERDRKIMTPKATRNTLPLTLLMSFVEKNIVFLKESLIFIKFKHYVIGKYQWEWIPPVRAIPQ